MKIKFSGDFVNWTKGEKVIQVQDMATIRSYGTPNDGPILDVVTAKGVEIETEFLLNDHGNLIFTKGDRKVAIGVLLY